MTQSTTRAALLLAFQAVLPTLLWAQTHQFERDPNRAPVSFLPAAGGYLDLADCDGDGDIDVAFSVASIGFSATLSLLRDVNGTWQSQVLLTTSQSPFQIMVLQPTWADLDRDGDPDLLCVASASNGSSFQFHTFRNSGGNLQLIRTTTIPGATGARPVVGDTDGDGDLDVLLAFDGGPTLTVGLALLVHDGQLGFVADPTAVPLVAPGAKPAFADFDGDGDLDVLVAEATGAMLRLTNVGGRFSVAGSVPGNTLDVATGDFDGDMDADALAVDRDGRISLLRNQGTGTLTATQVFHTTAAPFTISPFRVADFDGDQDLDAAIVNGGTAMLLRNDGSGTFTSEALVGNARTNGIAAADFHGDGRTDLLVQLFRGRSRPETTTLIHGAPGRMGVDPAVQRGLGMSATTNYGEVTACDFDGDGLDEVIETAQFKVIIEHNLGGGRFAEIVVPTPFWTCRDVELADVDGDGDLDLVLCGDANSTPALMVVRNMGALSFIALPLHLLSSYQQLAVGDLDADGDDDIVGTDSNVAQVFWSTGAGTLQIGPVIATGPTDRIHCCAIADFDLDGDLDVAVGGGNPCIAVLRNDGTGAFPTAVSCAINSPLATAPVRMGCADIDGDLDQDLVVSTLDGLRSYRNDGAANFAVVPSLAVTTGEWVVFALADFDGDGDIDVVHGPRNPFRLSLNDGTGTFVDAGTGRWNVTGGRLTVCHLDADGDPDLHSTNFWEPLVYNHLRALASLQLPLPGGQLVLSATHAAGFAPSGLLAVPCLSFAPRQPALAVPGIAGRLAISLSAGVVLPLMILAPTTGRGQLSVGLPAIPELVGTELLAQALFLPGLGLEAAWSPVVHERIGWR